MISERNTLNNLVYVCASYKVIRLSASSNKLSKLKDQADEYAALIMEELDPDHRGYIEVLFFY